jgi:propanediol dehydratase small subunit
MKMRLLFIGFMIVVSVLIALPAELKRRRLLKRFWSRSCTGRQWRRCFPDASNEAIREFLESFADAFAFSSEKRLKFGPDDNVMDVYRSLYPYSWQPDAMELELLACNLEDRYGFDITRINDFDITLGQIFEMTRKK